MRVRLEQGEDQVRAAPLLLAFNMDRKDIVAEKSPGITTLVPFWLYYTVRTFSEWATQQAALLPDIFWPFHSWHTIVDYFHFLYHPILLPPSCPAFPCYCTADKCPFPPSSSV